MAETNQNRYQKHARHQLGLNNSKGRPALRLAIAIRSQGLGEERTAMARRQQGYSELVQA